MVIGIMLFVQVNTWFPETLAVMGRGSVTVAEAVAVQDRASVTVQVYVPAERLSRSSVVWLFDQT
jgi:hypothetical protein